MNKSIKILHIEDLPEDTYLVERALQKAGIQFEIQVVENERDFIKALAEYSPDIILSDHSLPSFNSIEALKLVRNAGNNIPFILVTATMSEDFAVQTMKAGANDYILKDRLQRLPNAVINALEKHRLEIERQKFLEDIIANESLMKEAEQLAHIGSFNIHLANGQTKWSDELFRILEYQNDEVGPSLENFLKQVHPRDLQYVKDNIAYAIENLRKLTLEFRITDKNDKVKYIFSEFIIERDTLQKAISIAGFIQDVTQVKMAQLEISALNESLEKKVAQRTSQLEEANDELEAFNYTVSHDLRSPLQIINGYASILSMKYSKALDNEAQELVNGMKDSARRMGQIIDELLYFSRISHTELEREDVDMKKLITAVLSELKNTINGSNVKIEINDLPAARGDTGLLHHVWVNLISNAIKYSAKKSNPVIEIGTKKIDQKDVYYVKDNGVGFDMQNADKLFKVFQRLHNPSDFDGIGVGLALVQRIIHKHGGKIWPEASLDKGATFYFTLT